MSSHPYIEMSSHPGNWSLGVRNCLLGLGHTGGRIKIIIIVMARIIVIIIVRIMTTMMSIIMIDDDDHHLVHDAITRRRAKVAAGRSLPLLAALKLILISWLIA